MKKLIIILLIASLAFFLVSAANFDIEKIKEDWENELDEIDISDTIDQEGQPIEEDEYDDDFKDEPENSYIEKSQLLLFKINFPKNNEIKKKIIHVSLYNFKDRKDVQIKGTDFLIFSFKRSFDFNNLNYFFTGDGKVYKFNNYQFKLSEISFNGLDFYNNKYLEVKDLKSPQTLIQTSEGVHILKIHHSGDIKSVLFVQKVLNTKSEEDNVSFKSESQKNNDISFLVEIDAYIFKNGYIESKCENNSEIFLGDYDLKDHISQKIEDDFWYEEKDGAIIINLDDIYFNKSMSQVKFTPNKSIIRKIILTKDDDVFKIIELSE